MKHVAAFAVLSTALLIAGCAAPAPEPSCGSGGCPSHAGTAGPDAATGIAIPPVLVQEHAALHEELVQATRADGRTGEAARAVADRLHAHFVREEQIALPPLGLLEELARGGVRPEMGAVTEMTDALAAELPRMLEEHVEVLRALDALKEAATAEGRAEVAEFAGRLAAHARTEEQVLYPAAILAGDMVKRRLRE